MNDYGVTNHYNKKFNTEVPKKQAKSYEIDLGQNSGPYKEDLLIRYGDYRIHELIKTKNNNNMEDIMMMNERLKPYQEKSRDTEDDNFTGKSYRIESLISKIEEDSEGLAENENKLKEDNECSTNEYCTFLDATYNEFNPELLLKFKYLKTQIKDQKDENASLLKQIDLLNQEITFIFENIFKLCKRLDSVEKLSGVEIINE